MLMVTSLDRCGSTALFTTDKAVQSHLGKLMPILAWQQVLVSLTLVVESLAVGASQFVGLAVGTALATVACVLQISRQVTVEGIWSVGIVTLFAGRLASAAFACLTAQIQLRKHVISTNTRTAKAA